MANDFQTRLNTIRDEATQKKNLRKRAWAEARKSMKTIFREAKDVLQDDYADGELNGDISYLKRGNDKLEFRLAGDKVIRTSTREQDTREYDLDKVTEESIETEVEEFVRAIYS